MANTATAKTALGLKSPYFGSVVPVTIAWDTVQTDTTVYAAVTGKMIGIVGGQLQNNHATGAQTILFKSSTAGEIFRQTLAAGAVLSFGRMTSSGFAAGLTRTPCIVTQPGEGLVLRLNDATNQPINGVLYLATSDVFEIL